MPYGRFYGDVPGIVDFGRLRTERREKSPSETPLRYQTGRFGIEGNE